MTVLERVCLSTDIYKDMSRIFRQAKRTLDVCTYILDGAGVQSVLLARELNRAAKRGVRIRLVCSRNMWSTKVAKMIAHFCALLEPSANIQLREWRFRVFNNVHSKFVVADERRVLCTGANFEYWLVYCDWIDMSVSLTSPRLARAALAHFADVWRQSRPCDYPFLGQHLRHTRAFLKTSRFARTVVFNTRVYEAEFIAHMPCGSCARSRFTDISKTYYRLIRGARESLDMMSPNIDEPLGETLLREANGRGVRIRILTSLEMNEWAQNIRWRPTNFKAYRKLRDVSDWRFTNGHHCDGRGRQCKTCDFADSTNIQTSQHAKAMFVDDKWAVIGSVNFEILSFRNSAECAVVFRSRAVVPRLRRLFQSLWNKSHALPHTDSESTKKDKKVS